MSARVTPLAAALTRDGLAPRLHAAAEAAADISGGSTAEAAKGAEYVARAGKVGELKALQERKTIQEVFPWELEPVAGCHCAWP